MSKRNNKDNKLVYIGIIVVLLLIICLLAFKKNDIKTVADLGDVKSIEANNANKELEDKINTLTSQKDDLSIKVDELNNNIEELNNKINDLNNKLSKSNDDNKSLLEEINNLKNDKELLIKEKDELEIIIEGLNNTINDLKEELNVLRNTFVVFYSMNNETIYEEKVLKGNNVKNVPSKDDGNGNQVVWSNDGKNVQKSMVIYPLDMCTITFDSELYYSDPLVDLDNNSVKVPCGTEITFELLRVLVDGEAIVTATKNPDVSDHLFGGWLDEDDVKHTSGSMVVDEDITLTYATAGCVIKGTKILMADGTTKNIEDVKSGDMIASYSFFKGEIVSSKVLALVSGKGTDSYVFSVKLSNGNLLQIVDYENVFDMDSRKYVLVNKDNYQDLVGKRIMVGNDGTMNSAIIESITLNIKPTEHYTLSVAETYNYIANGVITMEDLYFENTIYTIDDNYKVDMIKYQEDIDKYGLYTYEECKDYISLEFFNDIRAYDAKIIEGKGYATREEIFKSFRIYENEVKNGK